MRSAALVAVAALAVGLPAAAAAELEPSTVRAFDRYVRLTEARMAAEEAGGPGFLFTERMTAERRATVERAARGSQGAIERLATRDGDRAIDVPDGLVHHWVGLVFIPGVTVERAVRLLQDYDRHAEIYAPAVARSKLLARDGNRLRVYLRFFMKKIIAVTLDTEHEAHFGRAADGRAWSRIRSTSVREVEDAGTPTERAKPEGAGRGYMWRLNTYWRFVERDGGTWVQCESVTLSNDIPFGLGWLIGPFVTEIPKESLIFTLQTTRRTLLDGGGR